MSKSKAKPSLPPRFALKKTRVQLEKLEDRVLLSVAPLLQLGKINANEPVSAENISFNLLKGTAGDTSYDVQALADAKTASVIDLSKGIEQDAALLAWATPSDHDLMKLSNSLSSLVLDLGQASDEVTLSKTDDGQLRLSGDSIKDLVFAVPTKLLAIRGGAGFDMVYLDNIILGASNLVVEAESISLPATKTLEGSGDFILRGYSNVTQSTDGSLQLVSSALSKDAANAYASVTVDGTVRTTAQRPTRLRARNSIAWTPCSRPQ